MVYLDKGFNKVFVNFVKIEVVYSKCHSSFLLKLKLYIYLKSDYVGEALPSAFFQPSSPITVIVLKAVHASLESGFGFKSFTTLLQLSPLPLSTCYKALTLTLRLVLTSAAESYLLIDTSF